MSVLLRQFHPEQSFYILDCGQTACPVDSRGSRGFLISSYTDAERRTKTTALIALAVVLALLTTAAPARATFPGSNGKIAFTGGTENGLFTVNPDGTALANLTRHLSGYPGSSSWSPDGRKIAFSFQGTGLFTMNANGSNVKKIVSEPSEIVGITWSPDGTKIAFGHRLPVYPHSFSISEVSRDGSNRTLLATNGWFPDWSPNGQQIVFSRLDRFGATSEGIWVMDAGGTNQRRLTTVGFSASWSPDGSRIAFDTPILEGDSGQHIWIMNGDGSDQRPITQGPSIDYRPAWSPDGTKIALQHNWQIWTMRPDGSELKRITGTWPVGNAVEYPRWQSIPLSCREQRESIGEVAFEAKYGTNTNGANALGKCESRKG